MALIEWQDEFIVGIPDIDHEHQMLVTLINEIHSRLKSGKPEASDLSRSLGEIYTQISAHFALEEMIMMQERYASFDEHKDDHDMLLDDVREIMDRVEKDQYYKYEDVLSTHLHDWFVVHFRTHDARLHEIFKR